MEDRVFYESLYEMHKAGKIDLMARSSVPEDEKERRSREAEPDAYALTYEESRTVIWAYNIYDTVTLLNNYIETDPSTGLKVRIINAESTEKIKQTFKEYGLNTTELYNLADRVFSENWFSLFLTTGSTPKGRQKLSFTLYAKIDGKMKKYPVSAKKYPAIYDNSMTKTEIRNAFDLPQNCKFLFSTEWDVLEVLKTVCNPNQTETSIAKIPEIFSIKVSAIEFPLDKLNNNIWRREPNQIDGQISLDIEMGKNGEGAYVCYSIDFEALEKDLQISKKLEPYDKRVYMAVNAIYNSREEKVELMSVTQIYNAMGNKGRPAASDIEKINNSITKMSKAHVTVDNLEESTKHRKQPRFVYDAALLPCERIAAYVNGQLTESALHIFREPPVMSFAKAHGQLTTITPALLQPPISNTESNIRLEDYLIDRIAKIKAGNSPNKILLSTVYANADITTVKQRQRAPEKIQKILDHFRSCEFIKGYKMDKISIVIKT